MVQDDFWPPHEHGPPSMHGLPVRTEKSILHRLPNIYGDREGLPTPIYCQWTVISIGNCKQPTFWPHQAFSPALPSDSQGFQASLHYIKSCPKYFSPHRALSPAWLDSAANCLPCSCLPLTQRIYLEGTDCSFLAKLAREE